MSGQTPLLMVEILGLGSEKVNLERDP